ncbi:MAG: hypothetical protein J5677_00400 [Bacteroidales bacterium]|nr:hypothetical protein [Bacteroidales bacterium]
MKTTVIFFALGLLMTLRPVAAQENFHCKPRAERVAHLSEEVEGTSSLFWMDGRLWTANDHGALKLYSLDTLTAEIDSIIDLGVMVYDLEEVTLDSNYLFFGDIGDNYGSRSNLRILRLARSDLAEGRYLFDTILFHYPERTVNLARDFDCEAFVAGNDSLYLFTKQWSSHNSDCYALPKAPGNYAAEHRFTLPADGLVTGACYLPEHRTLVLLGYSKWVKPFIYVIDGFEGEDFSSGRHRRTSLANPLGTQTEGVATLDGCHLFLTHETLSLRLFYRRASLLRLELPRLSEESNVN